MKRAIYHVMNFHITLATFPPAEAGRISSLSTTNQRDWRRRDFLPATPGHARFDPFAVAEMWTLKMLSDRGIGPQIGKDVANYCANAIVFQALQWIDAYESPFFGDKKELTEEELREAISIAQASGLDGLKTRFGSGEGRFPGWEKIRKNIVGQIFEKRPDWTNDILDTWFVWWADGTFGLQKSLNEAFGDATGVAKYAGAVVVLDLAALGSTFLAKTVKPLVKFTLSD